MTAHAHADAPATILARLDRVRRSGAGWTARCPGHDDTANSLSVGIGDDGRILFNCFAGCATERIVTALGLAMGDLFPDCQRATVGKGGGCPATLRATDQHSAASLGCTLAQYAEAKQLPLDRLREFGLSDLSYSGAPAVRMPYRDASGQELCIRFRLRLTKTTGGDDRFRWKTGSKPRLYGLDRLSLAHQRGYVTIVEGESDCHTLWCHDEPAVGIPGASNWRDDRDAADLADVPRINFVREPDGGGDTLYVTLAASSIRDRIWVIDLGGFKDPSALYLDDPAWFPKRWREAHNQATPLVDIMAAQEQTTIAAAWETCADLARDLAILDRVATTIEAAGVAGETRIAKILYLVVTSRLLDRPVSAAVKGPSSGGKSYLVENVLELFPPDAFYALTAMSERSLAYSTEPLAHRILVIFEAAGLSGDFASYLVRSLLSEGRVRYETVESTSEGLKPRLIEREGPTGLLVTTTAVHLHPENETRLLSITVNDSTDQTRRIFRALAEGQSAKLDYTIWHALQTWLTGAEHRVVIPFAVLLADLVPPVAVRLRRDFGLVLNLIRAHAILHQATRERDADGCIIATLADYAVVRELVADLLAEGVEATVSATVRETVETIERLLQLVGHDADNDDEPTVSVTVIAKALKIDKSAASRRVRVATDREYLKNLETRRGRPSRIALGDTMPVDVPVLPTVDDLMKRCSVDGGRGETTPPPSPESSDGTLCAMCETSPVAPGQSYLCDACVNDLSSAA